VRELLALLVEAGHADFRDARGPMGFTQRQAAGRFTRDEAAQLIAQLRDGPALPPAPALRQTPPGPHADPTLAIPSETLAAELRRRGWTVSAPER
jgi:hypothetical protein